MHYTTTVNNPTNRFKIIYIIALTFVGLIAITSQVIVRYVLEKQSADARIINIAGRQRMLSQKLTKTVLLLKTSPDSITFKQRQNELREVLMLWTKSHEGLQRGDASLELPPNHNSDTIKQMFGALEQHFQPMSFAANILISNSYQTIDSELAVQQAGTIIAHEAYFLKQMNAITFQYDKEAAKKISYLKEIELTLLILTLIILALEAHFIFRPAIGKIQEFFEQINEKNRALIQSNDELNKMQEELKIYIEELQATEEEVRQNLEELSTINDNLLNQKKIIEQQKELIDKRNQNVTDSIKAAKRVQDAILVNQEIIAQEFADIFILNRPKDIVSGDFYWFHQQGDKKIIVVGDCTGHGVAGALMTMVGVSLLNEVVNENKVFMPDQILQKIDDKLLSILQPNTQGIITDGMDLSVLVIEKDKAYFAAASNRLYWLKSGVLEDIKGGKAPLGAFSFYKNKEYFTITIPYEKGDIFYLFSDGYKDQYGQIARTKMGSRQFKNLISANAYLPMSQQFVALQQEIHLWKGAAAQTDDILLVGLKM